MARDPDDISELLKRRISEDQAAIKAEFLEHLALTPHGGTTTVENYIVETFDNIARWHLFVVLDFKAAEWYVDLLNTVRDDFLDTIAKDASLQRSRTPRLLVRLASRIEHWKSQALTRAREKVREAADHDEASQAVQPDLSWNNVRIQFVDEFKIRITAGTKRYVKDYIDLDLADGRSRNPRPDRTWETLRWLAECGGTLYGPGGPHRMWTSVEKSVQILRAVLRREFGIDQDPIPYVPNTGYRARFEISYLER